MLLGTGIQRRKTWSIPLRAHGIAHIITVLDQWFTVLINTDEKTTSSEEQGLTEDDV